MKHVSDFYQKLNFWIENLLTLSFFIIQELIQSPLVYIMAFINIYTCVKDKSQAIYYIILWFFLGFGYIIYFIMSDIQNLLYILSKYDGCKHKYEEDPGKTIAE